nr:carbamoyltransferase HypF [candidate division Zixibacteria bacterium]
MDEYRKSSIGAEVDNRVVVRLGLDIKGIVQGVGFRPFVYRLATDMGLGGRVNNSPRGVRIEIEGSRSILDKFIHRLKTEHPIHAAIETIDTAEIPSNGETAFSVRESDESGSRTALVLPDLAICPDCLKDIFDPDNRRYHYPFTNCTNCGPRYSIIETLPYDRARTTMKVFPMCEECRKEYENPSDRRFHAQPNACPKCGPHLELWDRGGHILETGHDCLTAAAAAIADGQIVALKGLGGFQLLADASKEPAVAELRRRKGRQQKPLALMCPDFETIGEICEVSEIEEKLLRSYRAPIVLLKRTIGAESTVIAASVAPDNPYLGVMLPYTPLHHLLMAELGIPVVATSGNLSEEPICIDEHEALVRLGSIGDLFIMHNRPIARQVDDSVVRVMAGVETVIRNARGYAPTSIRLSGPARSILAVGAHLKNSIALSDGNRVYLSQHIGDLSSRAAYEAMTGTIASLARIYDLKPKQTVCDLHPDYLSSQYALSLNLEHHKVQHHYAHVLACMIDNELEGKVLGVSWDGTGLGSDGTVWGGEFLRADREGFIRVAHLKTIRLPGGDRAAIEPRRSALGALYEIYGERLFEMTGTIPLGEFDEADRVILRKMLSGRINSPLTSSAGRLFDAVSSLLGICQINNYEGQAAMMLEYITAEVTESGVYPFEVSGSEEPYIIDWRPSLVSLLNDLAKAVPRPVIAARFHNTLAGMIVDVAKLCGENNIILTGGCFQNKYLLEKTVDQLEIEGFKVFRHRRIPPNDGGIAAGQILAAIKSKPENK